MIYQLKPDLFDEYFLNSNGKIIHNQGKYLKLFPYVTTTNASAIFDFDSLVGAVLCSIEGIQPQPIDSVDLLEKIKKITKIPPGQEEAFYEIIKQLFFDENGLLRPINVRMIEQIMPGDTSEKKMAEYLADVLGDKEIIKEQIQRANSSLSNKCNVLEALLLGHLTFTNVTETDHSDYFRVINSFKSKFEEDFAYIIESTSRTKEYLVLLFEFYYFIYTSQVSLQLDRFFDGDRTDIVPLFFSLDWEKTSSSRKCYTDGWQYLQKSISRMFAHAITLELLNLSSDESSRVDYIAIRDYIKENPEMESGLLSLLRIITDKYRNAILDCPDMIQIVRDVDDKSLYSEIQYLFSSVNSQFLNTGRVRAYDGFAEKFKDFCNKFLKNRGRIGMILNLSEEVLIFLTKLSIKNNDVMRLVDVFSEFECRGVFLDDISKDQIAAYYEKLNLIEKKSDSGDAKYVKRIL